MPKSKTKGRSRHDLLLEVGTEDLPPQDIANVLVQLETSLRKAFGELRIEFNEVRTLGTPRRLVAICRGVSAYQNSAHLRVKGPPETIAFDSHRRPTKEALGFARSKGVSVEDLKLFDDSGRRYVYAIVKVRAKKTTTVLPSALVNAVKSLTFSKTMRWDGKGSRFARPIRWIVALLGDTILSFSIGSIRSSNKTYGHRYLHPRWYLVDNLRAYSEIMRQAKVILDPAKRRELIVKQTTDLAAEVNATPILDKDLLEETVMSVEHPQALRGEFSRTYRSLPREVLTTVMRHHQKYFPIEDIEHQLQPYFVAVRDGDTFGIDKVRQGHEWVLAARLADAQFFFDLDRRHKLEHLVPLLEVVVLLEKLGTMGDKTRRLKHLCEYLAVVLVLDGRSANALRRSAELCKTDLVTHMVGEFPELQGVIGGIYAQMDGEPIEVARAIGEHYRPVNAGDEPPSTIVGALLALADKSDTLIGGISVGLMPTGSQDPYGLRRVAQGIVDILLFHRIHVKLGDFLNDAHEQLLKHGLEAIEVHKDASGRPVEVQQTIEFLRQRLRGTLIERGIRYDFADAALAVSGDELLGAAGRALALQAFSNRPAFTKLYTAYDRASRIITGAVDSSVDPQRFEDESERVLHDIVREVTIPVEGAASEGDFTKALDGLVPLAGPVDRLFDKVLIMSPDEGVKANRMALLMQVVDVFRNVADFSKVVMSEEEKFGIRVQGSGSRQTTVESSKSKLRNS